LVEYAAGKLEPESAAAVESHLAECSRCHALASAQASLWKTLDAWETPPVSADFDRRLYRRIGEDLRLSWWERISRPFRPMPLRQAVPLTATACLLLMAGLLLEHPSRIKQAESHKEKVRVEQVERTLDDMDLLHQFGITAASAQSDKI
jgi:anti-sigma factor RsiW